MDNKVLVIGADHHNTLGIVESLGFKGVLSYVIIVADIKNSFVLKSKYVTEGWICRTPEDVVEEMLSHFSDTKNKVIVYSSYDNVTSELDAASNRLSPYFILPVSNNSGSLRQKMSKEYMSELAREVGLNVPQTWIVSDGKIPIDVEYPCITKAISSIEGSKKNIRICQNADELLDFFKKSDHCPTIQIQKFVSKEYEFQFLGCSLNNGEHVIISGRTHIDRPNGIDNTFFLKFDKVEPEFSDTLIKAKEFIKRAGYSGTFSIEFLKDKNSGKHYFTETNFRNDGNAICQTSAGINIPYIYYLYYSGEDWEKELNNSIIKTTYLMPEIYYFKCMLKREVSLKEWWKNFRKTTCFISYFNEDSKPFWYSLKKEIEITVGNKISFLCKL